jgi:hypothetical protein
MAPTLVGSNIRELSIFMRFNSPVSESTVTSIHFYTQKIHILWGQDMLSFPIRVMRHLASAAIARIVPEMHYMPPAKRADTRHTYDLENP